MRGMVRVGCISDLLIRDILGSIIGGDHRLYLCDGMSSYIDIRPSLRRRKGGSNSPKIVHESSSINIQWSPIPNVGRHFKVHTSTARPKVPDLEFFIPLFYRRISTNIEVQGITFCIYSQQV
jgi:hypothetical protein